MKNRIFLLIMLLLICVLFPLQRSTAKITMKVVGSTTIQTSIDGTDDVTFTVEITSEAEDNYFGSSISVISDGRSQDSVPISPNDKSPNLTICNMHI